MFRLMKTSKNAKRLTELLKLNPGYTKLLQVAFSVLGLVHLVACFYFLIVKFNDFEPNCWVIKTNLMDAENMTLYITSIYWAFQTLTGVGYGDVCGYTS
jgi:hypothetical protein